MNTRPLLMIPGPIEFDPAVLQALGRPTLSHVDPEFIEIFGRCLEMMRTVWGAPGGQPIIVAGSGTFAMELATANLVEPGDRALVLSTGVFGDRFEDLLSRHGAEVRTLRAPVGATVDTAEIETALAQQPYKLLTVTHVDTSTGVRMPIREIGEMARRHDVLTVVDGVCSLAGEEIQQEAWHLDIVLTASQKALGVPPGLALLVAGPRSIRAFSARQTPVRSYYADWSKWIPIMNAYESRKPAYFGTPPVNLITALGVSLQQIVDEGMVARVARHRQLADAFREGLQAMGLRTVSPDPESWASTLTACHYPDGIDPQAMLAEARTAGVVIAAGLHPDLRGTTFRVGHMGAITAGDILTTLHAIESALRSQGGDISPGTATCAAGRLLAGR